MENLTKVERICGSSVADGVVSMLNVKDLKTARACLKHEQSHMSRTTMLKVIKRRIRQLQKP